MQTVKAINGCDHKWIRLFNDPPNAYVLGNIRVTHVCVVCGTYTCKTFPEKALDPFDEATIIDT